MEIKGQSITLRYASLDERQLVYDMALSTEYMNRCFAEEFEHGFESFKDEYVERYFDGSEPHTLAGMMICLDKKLIGFISYSQVTDYRDRAWIYHFGTMELDIWLDGEGVCGKGYGLDAILTLREHLHDTYGINRFMICPERINPRAMHTYEKAGFKEVQGEDKERMLRTIFGPRGLSALRKDDEYLSNDYCFMVMEYDL